MRTILLCLCVLVAGCQSAKHEEISNVAPGEKHVYTQLTIDAAQRVRKLRNGMHRAEVERILLPYQPMGQELFISGTIIDFYDFGTEAQVSIGYFRHTPEVDGPLDIMPFAPDSMGVKVGSTSPNGKGKLSEVPLNDIK